MSKQNKGSGSPVALQAMLRGGSGVHDTRPRGQRDRAGQKRAWRKDQED